ncbi:hypothetical protein D8771_25125 [Streptomyces albus]|uniref:Uncharacterized protein n=1 Tax=Streptomyces albus TaxID=1888 RepID=A0A8H1L671_9ACTN|nr:hypothetical protein ADL27_48440 [Streptomyces sp. NRRL F-6602]TGG78480.1 hypothetical protein D8771_25125 [Streptomyces albus]
MALSPLAVPAFVSVDVSLDIHAPTLKGAALGLGLALAYVLAGAFGRNLRWRLLRRRRQRG